MLAESRAAQVDGVMLSCFTLPAGMSTGTPKHTAGDQSAYDGRHARRDRNREAVVDAVVDLLTEGDPQPTAQTVADRSGVSLRSVFRYFEDLDSLLIAAIAEFKTRHADVIAFDQPPAGTPLDVRIDRWIDGRLQSYPVIARIMIAMYARARTNDQIMEALETERRSTIDVLAVLFEPELRALPAAEQRLALAAVHTATTIESWVNLVDRHALDDTQLRTVYRRFLRAALGLAPC